MSDFKSATPYNGLFYYDPVGRRYRVETKGFVVEGAEEWAGS